MRPSAAGMNVVWKTPNSLKAAREAINDIVAHYQSNEALAIGPLIGDMVDGMPFRGSPD